MNQTIPPLCEGLLIPKDIKLLNPKDMLTLISIRQVRKF